MSAPVIDWTHANSFNFFSFHFIFVLFHCHFKSVYIVFFPFHLPSVRCGFMSRCICFHLHVPFLAFSFIHSCLALQRIAFHFPSFHFISSRFIFHFISSHVVHFIYVIALHFVSVLFFYFISCHVISIMHARVRLHCGKPWLTNWFAKNAPNCERNRTLLAEKTLETKHMKARRKNNSGNVCSGCIIEYRRKPWCLKFKIAQDKGFPIDFAWFKKH
jgi:hypothetical protein